MSVIIQNVLYPDFEKGDFVRGSVKIEDGVISAISSSPLDGDTIIDGTKHLLTPGLIDCHCHIESSLLPPEAFGNTVMQFGTLHIIADCHEIANVAGRNGLEFFMENADHTQCNIKFALPSCVPATPFATSGGALSADDISNMMASDTVVALGEIMNIPAAVAKDPSIIQMVDAAKKHQKRINGHAPHLDMETLSKYISIGVEDDHESETYDELKQKIENGLYVFLREGTAEYTEADAYRIIKEYSNKIMCCTDDKSVHHILETGHINFHLKKAVNNGISPFEAIKSASYNGLKYYGLDAYAEVKVGNPASLVLWNDMIDFNPKMVMVNGSLISPKPTKGTIPDFIRNSFQIEPVSAVPEIPKHIQHLCMKVTDGSLITDKMELDNAVAEVDLENDILKIAVFERYGHSNMSAAKINGFELKTGAIASSVAHDCHNIVAVGTSDDAIMKAVNAVISENGGLSVFDGETTTIVPLHIGGIVSDQPAEKLSNDLEILKNKAHAIGCPLTDPFATLSFMALEVIPHLKITDKGLFDVSKFEYC